ncbi:MAG: hypothetical protein R6W81_01670, partial [Bacteroidales bacterium]
DPNGHQILHAYNNLGMEVSRTVGYGTADAQKNLINRENIYSLGSLIKKDISLSDDSTRFFKTTGSAIFDLYAARLVYEKSFPGSPGKPY